MDESGVAWSVFLSTTIFVITVVKFTADSPGATSWVHDIFTTDVNRNKYESFLCYMREHFSIKEQRSVAT